MDPSLEDTERIIQRDCSYKGSYETVKRFLMPLRAQVDPAQVC